MTYREMQNVVLEELGYDPHTVSSVPRERVKRRLNEWQRKILTRPHFHRLLRSTYSSSLTTVASQPDYAVPAGIDKIFQIRDATNGETLTPWTHHEIVQVNPDDSELGVPAAWAIRGWYGYLAKPAAGETIIYAVSSSASDTMGATVLLRTSEDLQDYVTLTLTGTTPVSAATKVEEVEKVYLATAPVGTVTFRYTTDAGTIFAKIRPGQVTSRYLWIRLHPIPAGAYTLDIDGARELVDMVDDQDQALLPVDFHDILCLAAESDEWKKKDDTRYMFCQKEVEARLNDLKGWVYNHPDYIIGAGQIEASSQLGPWFPRGS